MFSTAHKYLVENTDLNIIHPGFSSLLEPQKNRATLIPSVGYEQAKLENPLKKEGRAEQLLQAAPCRSREVVTVTGTRRITDSPCLKP